MTEFFQEYFVMALKASVVILIVLAIRPLLKRFSNRLACLLWLAVLFRLLCPYTLEGPIPAFWSNWENMGREALLAEESRRNKEGTASAMESVDLAHDEGRYETFPEGGQTAEGSDDLKREQARGGSRIGESAELMNVGAPDTSDPEEASYEEMPVLSNAEETSNAEMSVLSDGEKTSHAESDVWQEKPSVICRIGIAMARAKDWYHSVSGKIVTNMFGVIWSFVAGVLLLWGLYRYVELARKLREALPCEKWQGIPVKISDARGVPMTFGILRTRIYVPPFFLPIRMQNGGKRDNPKKQKEDGQEEKACFGITRQQWEYILYHEAIHAKRHDPFWKLVALLALGIHWWNPLVWLSYFLMMQDIEMACDEGVLRLIGAEERAGYAETLLCFAVHNSGLSLSAAFGESNAESRIRHVISYKKVSAGITATLAIMVLVLGGCLVTGPKESKAVSVASEKAEDGRGEAMPYADESGQSAEQGTDDQQSVSVEDALPDTFASSTEFDQKWKEYNSGEKVLSVQRADLTHDGSQEAIVLSVSYGEEEQDLEAEKILANGAPAYLRIYLESDMPKDAKSFQTKTAIYERNLEDGVYGEHLIYIAQKEGKAYLLTETQEMYQGEMNSECQVTALDENGEEYAVDSWKGPYFRVNINYPDSWNALPVDDMVVYSKKLNDWIQDGKLVVKYRNHAPYGGIGVQRMQENTFGAWEIWQDVDQWIEELIAPYMISSVIPFQGPDKIPLTDMEHLRESLENLNQRWLALYVHEYMHDQAYGLEWGGQDGKRILYSDLTGDLCKETITVDYGQFQEDDQAPIKVSVQNTQGKVLWSDELRGAHMGWGMYYHVIYGENQHYLLYLRPIEKTQGSYTGCFRVFSLDENGQVVILEERSIDSSVEQSNYTKAKLAYNEVLNQYLERSVLVVSIWDGELDLGTGRRVWR